MWAGGRFTQRPLFEEGVVAGFFADGSFRAVTGVDFCFWRQGEELGADAFEEAIKAAAGEVCATDGAAEEGVSGDDSFCQWDVEADAGRGVARGFEGMERVLAELQLHAFGEWMVDGGHAGSGEAEQSGLLDDAVVEGLLAWVHVGRNIQGFFCFGEGADMIEVGMGDEDGFYSNAEAFDFSEDDSRFVAWIDEEGFFGIFVGDDRTILLK